MNKKIVDVQNARAVVFFEFPISPIASHYEEQLYKHLLETVWGEFRSPTEDIRVGNDMGRLDAEINEVRYQIDLASAEYRFNDIAELVEQEVEVWVGRMGGYEEVRAQ